MGGEPSGSSDSTTCPQAIEQRTLLEKMSQAAATDFRTLCFPQFLRRPSMCYSRTHTRDGSWTIAASTNDSITPTTRCHRGEDFQRERVNLPLAPPVTGRTQPRLCISCRQPVSAHGTLAVSSLHNKGLTKLKASHKDCTLEVGQNVKSEHLFCTTSELNPTGSSVWWPVTRSCTIFICLPTTALAVLLLFVNCRVQCTM
jgi:hypothetical protein